MDVFSPREKDPSGDCSSSSRYKIRTVQLQDLFEISGILADSFPLHPPFMQWLSPIMRVGIHEDLRSRIRSPAPHYACLVAVDKTRIVAGEEYIVGTVEVGLRSSNPWQPQTSQYAYLSNLAVRKECRRQGIAQQMLVECDRTVLEWGFQNIYLHVLETNERARLLYLKAGYCLEEVQPSWNFFLGQPRRLLLRKHLGLGIRD